MMKSRQELFEELHLYRGDARSEVIEEVVLLAVELAREGREGRKVGTLFIVGDEERVMRRSYPLILDPLYGHPDEKKMISSRDMRETCKELAMMDGAFIVSADGIVVSACRYIDTVSEGIALPMGLGSRHMAAASITAKTGAVAVVVSESAIVRIFANGQIIAEIIPEIWMLDEHPGFDPPSGAEDIP